MISIDHDKKMITVTDDDVSQCLSLIDNIHAGFIDLLTTIEAPILTEGSWGVRISPGTPYVEIRRSPVETQKDKIEINLSGPTSSIPQLHDDDTTRVIITRAEAKTLRGRLIKDVEPDEHHDQSPAAPLDPLTLSARAALIEDIGRYLSTNVDDALSLVDDILLAAKSKIEEKAPPVAIGYDDLGQVCIINPRTHEIDTLIAVDIADLRHTALKEHQIDIADRSIHIEYDSHTDYHDLCYVTESDGLPVTLPDHWREV